ncbi:plasma protease C1 inhibitor [Hoplias malabaricus]|uniref:plasma protease C1 inhibitor n=1 Tax=Hoplias malabaricus TaxID=27720 RepID=UPI003462FF88
MLRSLLLLQFFWGFSSAVLDISVPVGSNFSLTCLDDPDIDLLFPTFTWTFTPEQGVGEKSQSEVQLKWTEAQLGFSPIQQNHAGLYTCVTKGHGSEGLLKIKRRFKILVIKELPILYKWWMVLASEGDTVRLPCRPFFKSLTNNSSSNARWFRELKVSTELQPGGLNLTAAELKDPNSLARRISWVGDPQDGDWAIEISDVKPQDVDLYRCDVTVDKEKQSWTVELIVEPAPPPRCLNQSGPWEACPDPDNRSWKAILSESITAFSAQLYNKLRKSQPSKNLLISPIGIAGLLSHLLLGARKETRAELERAMSLPTDFSCIHSEMKEMREEMQNIISIASQMFYNPEFTLREAFVNQSLEFYDTVPERLTNSSGENVQMINQWVSAKTQKRINQLVDSVDPSTQFILLNAVYFIGKWQNSFEEKSGNGEFMTLSGKMLSVPILSSSKYDLATTYISELKAQVGKFPLTGKSSLYILVPNVVTESALSELEDRLTDVNIQAMVKELDSLPPTTSEVTLPKTKLSITTDLNALLQKMGVKGVLGSPNLCGMFEGDQEVELTDARHRVYLSLGEQGVEAAAASSVTLSRSYNSFNAMQPFVFILWSEQTSCPLFIGRVLHPSSKQ